MKSILYSFIIAIITISSFTFTGCSDDTNPVAPGGPNVAGLTLLSEQYAIGGRAKVQFYSKGDLKTGYNKIYLVLYDSVTNNLITDSHIEFVPVNHGVTAPVENPPSLAVDGVFEGAIIFTDPQVTDHWHIHIHVHNHQAPGEPDGVAEVEGLTILDAPDSFMKFQPDTTTTYLFSLVHPMDPSVGQHDYEFIVSQLVGAAYVPFDDCHFDSLAVSTGGNASTGNVLPVLTENGHYRGSINLHSAGEWTVFMKFRNHALRHSFSANFFKIHAQ